MTIIDPRTDPDALTISVGDSHLTLAAMLEVLTDGAAGGFVISYTRPGIAPLDLVVDQITTDDDTDDNTPLIVGRLWDTEQQCTTPVAVRLPVDGAAIHIY